MAIEERRMFPQAPIDDGVLAAAIEVRDCSQAGGSPSPPWSWRPPPNGRA